MRSPHPNRAFTLIELLIVIGIIGALSSIILVSLDVAREKAKVMKAVAQIREVNNAAGLFKADTGTIPDSCGLDCDATKDPYLNALGVTGWNGPYLSGGVWNMPHAWLGHFSVIKEDLDSDGTDELYVLLDEDAPGTNEGDNTGPIPLTALKSIDRILDDGDLSTGEARGNGDGFSTAEGEIAYRLEL